MTGVISGAKDFIHQIPNHTFKLACTNAVISSAATLLYIASGHPLIAITTALSSIAFTFFDSSLTPVFNIIFAKDSKNPKIHFSAHIMKISIAALAVNLLFIPIVGFQIHLIYTISLNVMLTSVYCIYHKSQFVSTAKAKFMPLIVG